MKKGKKIAAVVTAAVLVGSAALVAGCGTEDFNPAKNYDFGSSAKQLVNALDKSYEYLGYKMDIESTHVEKCKDTYSEEFLKFIEKLQEENPEFDYSEYFPNRDRQEVSARQLNSTGDFNVKRGEGDISIHQSWYEEGEYEEGCRDYVFLRNSKIFTYRDGWYDSEDEDVEVTDFSNCLLKSVGEAKLETLFDMEDKKEADALNWITRALKTVGIDTETFFTMQQDGLYDANVALIALADAANAVTLSESTVTLDINKLAYALAQDAKTLVNSVDEYTTVSTIYKNSIVKKWVQAATAFVDFDEVRKYVEDEIQPVFKNDFEYSMPKVDKGDDVYGYVLKLLDDTAFATRVLDIPTALGALSVEGAIDLIYEDGYYEGEQIDFDTVKEYVNECAKDITPAALKIAISDEYTRKTENDGTVAEDTTRQESKTYHVSGAKIVYTLSGGKVTKMEASCDEIKIDSFEIVSYSVSEMPEFHTVTYEYNDTIDFHLTVELGFADKLFGMADIDNCLVTQKGYVEGMRYVYLPQSQTYLTVTLKPENGKATELVIKNEYGNTETLTSNLGVSNLNGAVLLIGDETYTVTIREEPDRLYFKIEKQGNRDYSETYFWKTDVPSTKTVKDIIG